MAGRKPPAHNINVFPLGSSWGCSGCILRLGFRDIAASSLDCPGGLKPTSLFQFALGGPHQNLRAAGRWVRPLDVPSRAKRSRTRNAGGGRRPEITGVLLLQVRSDLPNPAKYEADRRRDSDFDNHQQHQNHRYLPPELMALGCTSKGYRSVFHATTLVNRPGARGVASGTNLRAGAGKLLFN
jgi:hypothetical protein